MRLHLDDGERVQLLTRLGLPETTSEADLAAAVQTRLFVEEGSGGNGDGGTNASASGGTTEHRTEEAGNRNSGSTEASAGSSTSEADGGREEGNDLPDGDDGVWLDVEAYNRLQARSREADALREQARVDTRDNLVAAAIRDGKIPPSRRRYYQDRYDDDPDNVTARINRMPKNVIPVHERGVDAKDDDVEAKDSYPSEWLPESRQAQTSAKQPDRASLSSRVHSEE